MRNRPRRSGDLGLEKEGEVEIDLHDELGSLLDSLNVWWEKVAVGELMRIPGFSHHVELKLLDF